MKIGFIGVGNMASAIIKGIITKEFVAANEVYLFDPMTEKVTAFAKEHGCQVSATTAELIEAVDTVLLAVKPNVIESVLQENKALITTKKPLLI